MMKNNHILSYDTIKITLTNDMLRRSINFIKEIGEKIEIKRVNYAGNQEFKGNIKNFRIWGNAKEVKLQGSLVKFRKGNNLDELGIEEAEVTVRDLSDLLKLPLWKADLRRVDLGCNIEVESYPELYFDYLGQAGGFNRRIFEDSTLYYENKTRSGVVIYDKVKEMKRNCRNFVVSGGEGHLLRFETRAYGYYVKNIMKPRVRPTAGHLYNPKFYNSLCNRSREWYESITKIGSNPLSYGFEDLNSPKDIVERCICYANREVDVLGEMKRRFGNRKTRGKNDNSRHARLKRPIEKALGRMSEFSTKQPLERELDQKLQWVFNNSIILG